MYGITAKYVVVKGTKISTQENETLKLKRAEKWGSPYLSWVFISSHGYLLLNFFVGGAANGHRLYQDN